MRAFFTVCCMLTFFLIPGAKGATGPGDWVTIGSTNESTAPYGLLYFKLVQVNSDAHRYATIFEVNIQADANYFYMQGTYRIRVDKHEGTVGRFDGLEVKCISGNPSAANFYVYNNALWVRSNFQWGIVNYRTVGDFGTGSPMNTAPFNQTLTAPVGYVASTNSSGIKCDFDNNKFYMLSAEDVNGNVTNRGKVGVGTLPAFPLHVVSPGNTDKAAAYLWGENYGVAVGTLKATAANYAFAVLNNANTDGSGAAGGSKSLFYVRGDGNVGIGTSSPQAKLAVNGEVVAKSVKVTLTGWADFVFHPDYQLPSLQEVASFIKTNQHLQDIPSEKEVIANGLDLGEMNKLLLKKVEEQMLYIIELNKKVEESLERTRALEQQLEKRK